MLPPQWITADSGQGRQQPLRIWLLARSRHCKGSRGRAHGKEASCGCCPLKLHSPAHLTAPSWMTGSLLTETLLQPSADPTASRLPSHFMLVRTFTINNYSTLHTWKNQRSQTIKIWSIPTHFITSKLKIPVKIINPGSIQATPNLSYLEYHWQGGSLWEILGKNKKDMPEPSNSHRFCRPTIVSVPCFGTLMPD